MQKRPGNGNIILNEMTLPETGLFACLHIYFIFPYFSSQYMQR